MNSYLCLIFGLVAMTTLLSASINGQMYHFSNGWNPGKRASTMEPCHFRSEVKALVFKLIEDELARIITEQSCYGGLPALKSLLKKDISYTPMEEKK